DEALAVVVPVRIDAHEQVSLLPVDRIVLDESLARPRRVEPEAEEPVLPHRRDGVVGPRDHPRMTRPNGLPGERFGDPDLPRRAVIKTDVRVFAVEFVGADAGVDAWSGGSLGVVG